MVYFLNLNISAEFHRQYDAHWNNQGSSACLNFNQHNLKHLMSNVLIFLVIIIFTVKLFTVNVTHLINTCCLKKKRCLLPHMPLLPDYCDIKCVCVWARLDWCKSMDICVCVCQLFSSRPVTLDLVIHQPHMRDCTLNTGMTQPPFDRDLADLLELSCMWFHFKAANMACIKHNTVNWMSGFTWRCVW